MEHGAWRGALGSLAKNGPRASAPTRTALEEDCHRRRLVSPLELFRKGDRWVMVDGYHRLAHHHLVGSVEVPVRLHSEDCWNLVRPAETGADYVERRLGPMTSRSALACAAFAVEALPIGRGGASYLPAAWSATAPQPNTSQGMRYRALSRTDCRALNRGRGARACARTAGWPPAASGSWL